MSRWPLYEDGDVLVEGELYEGNVFLHTEVKSRFNKTLYTNLLFLWADIIDALKEKGITEVFSCIPKDKKIMKWQTLFGMSPLLEGEDWFIYRREL